MVLTPAKTKQCEQFVSFGLIGERQCCKKDVVAVLNGKSFCYEHGVNYINQKFARLEEITKEAAQIHLDLAKMEMQLKK